MMSYTNINDYLMKCIKNNYHCQHCAKNHDGTCFFAFECFMDDMKYYDEDDSNDIPDDVDESNYNPYTGCDEYEVEPFDEEW